jgi:TetR/AcrR family transcriptional regulator, transcriptional repressor for nem operon
MARPRTFDESEIVRLAREPFWDHGYAATSVEQLTAATGLQRSSLYGAFGDKHGLFVRAFGQYCEENMDQVRGELAGDDSGAFARLRRHLRRKTDDPVASRRGCMLAKVSAELADQDAEAGRLAADAYAIYEEALTECFRAAQRAGDARADIDAAAGGALLLATLRGIEALGRVGHSKAALRKIADAALASIATAPATKASAPGTGTKGPRR